MATLTIKGCIPAQPPVVFRWRRPTPEPTGAPVAAQAQGLTGGGGTYQEPLLDSKTIIRDALAFLHPNNEVFELCVTGPKTPKSTAWEGYAGGKKAIVAGWFKDHDKAAALAAQIQATGIYVTLNPCQEALLARANHRLKANVDRTADNHIERIKNLLIDIDPIRPAGISSTDQEHGVALEMAQAIKGDLAKEGWPDSLVGDSGNGCHLVYPVDLPNTPESVALLKAVLQALAQLLQEPLASLNLDLDQVVFNPARLTKLYGTMVRKGDNTQDRPHRLAQIISLPETRRPVPLELLQKLAATVPSQGPAHAQIKEPSSEGRFDLEAYLAHYRVEVVKVKPHGGSLLYCLQECLFDPSHNGNEAAIGQAQDGKLFYQCFHNSCKHTWAEARAIISDSDKLNRFIVGGGSRTVPGPLAPAPDYDSRERAAIQTEAPAPVHKKTLVLGTALTTAVAEGLRAAGVAEDVISQAMNIVEQSGGPKGGSNLSAEVKEWVLSSSGVFHSSDVVRELGLSSLSSDRNFSKNLSKILERLVKEGCIGRHGDRRGCFRRIERESELIDFANADTSTIFDLRWPAPFHLERLVNLYPKNIIIVAGATNAGKTALLLNVIRENMAQHRIIYFSSEMGAEELRLRLEKFDLQITSWRFEARERGGKLCRCYYS